MTDRTTAMRKNLRDRIIANPQVVLEDREVMRALAAANEHRMGTNIVDLRGIAMQRLETRLERIEKAHRHVVAAAYDNVAGTSRIHRAVLYLLGMSDLHGFLTAANDDLAQILKVDRIRLVLESADTDRSQAIEHPGPALKLSKAGFINGYLTSGRNIPVRQVTLRQIPPDSPAIYGEDAEWLQSEALLRLNLGTGQLPGLLAMGAEDADQFAPGQGTNLLAFLAGVVEWSLPRWLGR